jgi:thiamine kinase-like enzyme
VPPVADAIPQPLLSLLDGIPSIGVDAPERPRWITPLLGGLTNHNYRIDTTLGCFVARLSSPTSELLAIDRDAEHRNSRVAAATGIAPQVVHYRPGDDSVLIIEWVEGRTWSAADVREPANLPRIARACHQLHDGAGFVNDFSMFSIQREYLGIVLERAFRLPPRYLDFMPVVAEIEAAMSVHPERKVPCHNDLLAENFIDDGSKLWLIDYEYAGNNEPSFELGNIASESGLDDEGFTELVRCYYGSASPARLARAQLWALMSQYGWTLWAVIQNAVSELDFDFWSWGMEKYDRAVATFDGAGLSQLLLDVRQPDQPNERERSG